MAQTRKILLIVSGGIAAYKAANLVRHFRKQDAEVRVVMTRSAEEFIAPMTLQVLSENKVGRGLFEPGFEYEIGHIELARWPDVVLVAPATANIMAKARAGMADDLATTVLLATSAPVVFCPAMNTVMLEHHATQENLSALRAQPGVHVLDPDSGELACKEVGAGRLPDAPVIGEFVNSILSGEMEAGTLRGKRVVITAGPTREYFDPVRFISNPSTGRMGYALADAFARAGADTTLVSGPTELEPPGNVTFTPVVTAQQMYDAVFDKTYDIGVMAAAVADYRPKRSLDEKRKKSDDQWQPEFERTPDILQSLSESNQRPACLIGFAAETEDVVENAVSKLRRKSLDGIVANSVSGASGAFGSCSNQVVLIDKNEHQQSIERAPKPEVARRIVRWVSAMFEESVEDDE
jgi:phosphopantothenoylcysteine decarboxylase/phosphopantothenate--cysteine ligase